LPDTASPRALTKSLRINFFFRRLGIIFRCRTLVVHRPCSPYARWSYIRDVEYRRAAVAYPMYLVVLNYRTIRERRAAAISFSCDRYGIVEAATRPFLVAGLVKTSVFKSWLVCLIYECLRVLRITERGLQVHLYIYLFYDVNLWWLVVIAING